MPGYLDPKSNITWGYNDGEDGWGGATNRSLRQLAYYGIHPTVKNRTSTAPPSSPVEGDKYIVAANPTGLWSTFNRYDIAVWGRSLSTPATLAWQRLVPVKGVVFYDESSDNQVKFNGTAWEEITGGGGGVGPVTPVPAVKPIWADGTTLSRTNTTLPATLDLGIVDLNPVGTRIPGITDYGANVRANLTLFPSAVSARFNIETSTGTPINTILAYAGGTDLRNFSDETFLSSSPAGTTPASYRTHVKVTVQLYGSGNFEVSFGYTAGPKVG